MNNWFFRKQSNPYFYRSLRRRWRGERPLYGERLFAAHERRSLRVPRAILALLAVAALLFPFVGAVGAAGAYSYYGSQMPSVDLIFSQPIAQSTLVYDRNGNLLDEIYDPNQGHRILVPLSEIPATLLAATLSAEDPNFFQAPGVDPTAVARAAVTNLQSGSIVSGASTLPMQLVRNVLFDLQKREDRSFSRKIEESILAIQLAMRYSKNDILEMYLNQTYYGNQSYGVQAASLYYFGKTVDKLSLSEAALLAGLPQSPTSYNPYENPDLALKRRAYVLDQMAKYGYITQAQADEEKAATVKLSTITNHFQEAPHFALYVRQLLIDRYGHDAVYYGGLRVVTTIDLQKQAFATQRLQERIAQLKSANANDAALVSIDPRNGEVLAMVGSADFNNVAISGQMNMAITPRQPGSSVKPYTYVTAFEKIGYVPASQVFDTLTCYPQPPGAPAYCPHNWNFVFNGVQPIRVALAASLNIPALDVLYNIGVPAFVATAHKFGITDIGKPVNQYGLAITLGAAEIKTLDHVFGYTVFANNGRMIGEALPPDQVKPGYAPYGPASLLKVSNYRGETIYNYSPAPPIQVVPAEYAYLITASISDDSSRVLTYGRHSYLDLSRPNAAKTGTTEFRGDAWTMGYTPDLVAGVWVGNPDNSPMLNVEGVSAAGVIWHNYMEDALKGTPPTWFAIPPNIGQGDVCGRQGDVYVIGRAPNCTVQPPPAPASVAPPPAGQ